MMVYRPADLFDEHVLLDGLLSLPPLDIAVIHQNSRRRIYSLGAADPARPRGRQGGRGNCARDARWHARIVVPSDTPRETAERIEDILVGNIEEVDWDARSTSRATRKP